MSFKLRYQAVDFEGEQARRFAEQMLKTIQPGYPEYVSADGDAYDYGNQYEIVLVRTDGVKRKIRIRMKDKPSPALASILFLKEHHGVNDEQSVELSQGPLVVPAVVDAPKEPPKPRKKTGRSRKAKYVAI